jgi:hypothetical protein
MHAEVNGQETVARGLLTHGESIMETPTAVPNEVSNVFSAIVAQLAELWNGPEEDEYGRLRPTQDAFDAAMELFSDSAMPTDFDAQSIPHGCVSTDSEGGVRIEWITDRASVHLIVPSKKTARAYVYHELGSDYATEDATAERLTYWLRSLS